MIMKCRNSWRWAPIFLIVGFFILSAFGCGGGGGGSSSSDGGSSGGGSGEITLSTSDISFGNVVANAQGLRSADRSVSVTNVGTGTLRIRQIDQTALAPPFLIFDDNCSGVALAPNASCSVVVRFQPTQPAVAVLSDSFSIPSDDADEPSLTVNVSGNAKGLNVTINKVDTTGFPNVRIIVSVTDGDNNPVTGLNESAFIISEGSARKASNFFSNTVNTSVSAFMALDNSNSLGSTDITRSRNAAKLFVDLLAPGTDEAAVSKFARGVFLAADFTPIVVPPQTALHNAIDGQFPLPRDATFLFDAAYDAVDRLGTPGRKDRRAAIVLTDGNDFDLVDGVGSTRTADDVIDNAQQNGVFIFTIGLGSKVNTEVLQEMAVSTGGQYFFAPTSADLGAIYQQISAILTNQYELRFATTLPVGSSTTLGVGATQGALEGSDTSTVVY